MDLSPFEELAISQEIPVPFKKISKIYYRATACQLSLP